MVDAFQNGFNVVKALLSLLFDTTRHQFAGFWIDR